MDIMAMTAQLAEGFLVTVQIFVFTLLFSLPLGMLVAFGRMSRCKIIKLIAKLYISVMRGTPLMLQIIVVYFAPYYMFRMKMGPGYRFPAVIIAFVINYAAYFAEIYRSGIESMPNGQYEAAQVLGYNKAQTFIRIILPQVIKRVLPSITNETITLVKGYIACIYDFNCRDVHCRQANWCSTDKRNAAFGSRYFLLCI